MVASCASAPAGRATASGRAAAELADVAAEVGHEADVDRVALAPLRSSSSRSRANRVLHDRLRLVDAQPVAREISSRFQVLSRNRPDALRFREHAVRPRDARQDGSTLAPIRSMVATSPRRSSTRSACGCPSSACP